MNTAFLVLDECTYAPLDLAALTGVLVPADRYAHLRDAMCRLAVEVQPSSDDVIPGATEFHARALLNDIAHLHGDHIDSVRLMVLRRVVNLVLEHRLDICRVTYLNRTEIARAIPGDPKLYGLTFAGIQSWLQRTMASTLVIPIMDGVPATGGAEIPRRAPHVDSVLIRAFAANVRTIHHLRQYPQVASNLSIANATNLGEALFADSAHSVLLQMVDIVSHLLLQIERAEHEGESTLGDFRRESLAIGRQLPTELLHLWSGKMSIITPEAAQQAVAADGASPRS